MIPMIPVMRVTESDDTIWYIAGNDEADAFASFGPDIVIEYGYWVSPE